MVWTAPKGKNVDAVRTAVTELSRGKGSFDDLRNAVENALFAVRPTATSLKELGENWDYQPMPDTFTDAVLPALFMKVITTEQYADLVKLAKYTGPEPSREPSA